MEWLIGVDSCGGCGMPTKLKHMKYGQARQNESKLMNTIISWVQFVGLRQWPQLIDQKKMV